MNDSLNVGRVLATADARNVGGGVRPTAALPERPSVLRNVIDKVPGGPGSHLLPRLVLAHPPVEGERKLPRRRHYRDQSMDGSCGIRRLPSTASVARGSLLAPFRFWARRIRRSSSMY